MLKEFKNLELLRFYITKNIDKSMKEISKTNDKNSEIVTSSFFSVGSAFLIAYITEKFLQLNKIIESFILLSLFLLSYFIILYLSKIFYKKVIEVMFYSKIHKNEQAPSSIKEKIDDFDHVACDNILIANEFISKYDKIFDVDIKTFYFYEVIYYLNISIDITQKVASDPLNCLNINTKCKAIELYRVYNIVNMMSNIFDFLDTNKEKINIKDELKEYLITCINNIKGNIKGIKDSLDNLLKTEVTNPQ